jgi:hypothetical protein
MVVVAVGSRATMSFAKDRLVVVAQGDQRSTVSWGGSGLNENMLVMS